MSKGGWVPFYPLSQLVKNTGEIDFSRFTVTIAYARRIVLRWFQRHCPGQNVGGALGAGTWSASLSFPFLKGVHPDLGLPWEPLEHGGALVCAGRLSKADHVAPLRITRTRAPSPPLGPPNSFASKFWQAHRFEVGREPRQLPHPKESLLFRSHARTLPPRRARTQKRSLSHMTSAKW